MKALRATGGFFQAEQMRTPNLEIDGWRLEDAEVKQAANPGRFIIPTLEERESLIVGDMAQLIFEIAVDDDEDPTSGERMWVVVSETFEDGYIGILNNRPGTIAENDGFWEGDEIPFEPRHVIDIVDGHAGSLAVAYAPPRNVWPRD
jgi:uncharacterized protein YegJ (DUF2314 family)